jgi:hypothetical protein
MSEPTIDPFDRARAEAMICGYHARWSGEQYEVLAVEAEFRAPLVNPETGAASRTWQRGGKLDVVVRELGGQGRIGFIEHKTSSDDIAPGSPYWKQLRMDGQVSGYFVGADALGFPAEFCLYDVLGKPKLRPYEPGKKRAIAETPGEFRARCMEAIAAEPDRYFRRGEVVRLEAEAAEALFDDWQTAVQMREGEHHRRFPRNPGACMRWGRACDFFDVCAGEASIDDPSRFRRSEHVNPELEARGGLPVLSASRLRAARSCQRLHRFEYLDGIRPIVEADTLRFGSLIHRGLEAWWRAARGERLDAAIAALTPSAVAAPAAMEAAATA